jgi:pyruvate decarboxylase
MNFSNNIFIILYLEFHTYHTKIFYAIYDKVDMRYLLPDLTEQWPAELIYRRNIESLKIPSPILDEKNNEIVHEYFWNRLPDFIPENSIVVAETGTSEFGKFN